LIQKSIDNNNQGKRFVFAHIVLRVAGLHTFAQLEQSEIQSLKRELEQVAADHIQRRYTTKSPLRSVLPMPLVATPWFERILRTS